MKFTAKDYAGAIQDCSDANRFCSKDVDAYFLRGLVLIDRTKVEALDSVLGTDKIMNWNNTVKQTSTQYLAELVTR